MRKQTLVTLLHLAMWSQLGVLTRTFVGKFFQLGCNGQWGPCVQGENLQIGVSFSFFASNKETLSAPSIILCRIYIYIYMF